MNPRGGLGERTSDPLMDPQPSAEPGHCFCVCLSFSLRIPGRQLDDLLACKAAPLLAPSARARRVSLRDLLLIYMDFHLPARARLPLSRIL